MMIIDLEDLVGNAVCSLFNEKGIDRVDLKTINKYQDAISEELKRRKITFGFDMSRNKTINFINYNKYFDVHGDTYNSQNNLLFVMKLNITSKDLYRFRGFIPFELLTVMLSEPVLKTLGIEKENTSSKSNKEVKTLTKVKKNKIQK
ncbi:MAG: hypothetical protein E7166_01300 [Firmicutes bacterium]|nr:hypothetical protein [Bacillota bacterium]